MKNHAKSFLVYNISYKTLIGSESLHIRFGKIDGFNRVYDGTGCLVLFDAEKYDFIHNKIRYVIGVKSGITYVFSHNNARIKVDSYNSLSLEKTLTFHNFIILINSVFNKDKNDY